MQDYFSSVPGPDIHHAGHELPEGHGEELVCTEEFPYDVFRGFGHSESVPAPLGRGPDTGRLLPRGVGEASLVPEDHSLVLQVYSSIQVAGAENYLWPIEKAGP